MSKTRNDSLAKGIRQDKAAERQEVRETRSNAEQLEVIQYRLGKLPACKEVLRLNGLNEDLTNKK